MVSQAYEEKDYRQTLQEKKNKEDHTQSYRRNGVSKKVAMKTEQIYPRYQHILRMRRCFSPFSAACRRTLFRLRPAATS